MFTLFPLAVDVCRDSLGIAKAPFKSCLIFGFHPVHFTAAKYGEDRSIEKNRLRKSANLCECVNGKKLPVPFLALPFP